MRRSVRTFGWLLLLLTVPIALIVIMANQLSTSQEANLTGLTFQLSETAFFDDTGVSGEGRRVWIYRIPEDVAIRMGAPDYPLSKYPLWSPLWFDGYQQTRWTPASAAVPTDFHSLLQTALDSQTVGTIAKEDIVTIDQAREFANNLLKNDDTLVAGWYTSAEGDLVPNYFVYVMNLEQRILIKLSQLN